MGGPGGDNRCSQATLLPVRSVAAPRGPIENALPTERTETFFFAAEVAHSADDWALWAQGHRAGGVSRA